MSAEDKHEGQQVNKLLEEARATSISQPARSLECAQAAYALAQTAGNPDLLGRATLAFGIALFRTAAYTDAREHLLAALAMLEAEPDSNYYADALFFCGHVHQNMGDLRQAGTYLLQAVERYEQLQDRKCMARSLATLGDNARLMADYSTALEYFSKGLELAAQLGDRGLESAMLVKTGTIYFHLEDYPASLATFERSMQVAREAEDIRRETNALINVAGIHALMGNHTKALRYFRKGLEVKRKYKERYGEAAILANMAGVYHMMKDDNEALRYLRESLVIRRAIQDRYGEGHCLYDIGEILLEQARARQKDEHEAAEAAFGETHEFLLNAKTVFEEVNARDMIPKCYMRLSELYEAQGNTAEALAAYKLFHENKEAVFNEQSDKRVRSLMVRHERDVALREKEIYRLRNVELEAANTEIQRQQEHVSAQTATIRHTNSELQQRISQLEELNREKNEIIGIVSHDLRNPLNVLINYGELLQCEPGQLLPEEILDYGADILSTARSMLEIVTNLLDLNRLEQGRIAAVIGRVDMDGLLPELLQRWESIAKAKQQNIALHSERPNTAVLADAGLCRQILDNLVSNAIKYSPPGKSIDVYIRRESSEYSAEKRPAPARIRVEVHDQGPGIAVHEQHKLFQKFQTLSARPTANENSTGLGLSIVRKLAEIMNASVWCESTPGRGAVFIVAFTAADPD